MIASDPTICTAGKADEFSTFSCPEAPLPSPSDIAAVDQRLTFRWVDAAGKVISQEKTPQFDIMPTFPISLIVVNQWGQSVTSVIPNAPQGAHCPPYKMLKKQRKRDLHVR
jgi:hypothetical protein